MSDRDRHREQTFAMVKPDAVRKSLAGEIIRRIEQAGFTIQRLRMETLSLEQARGLYAVHENKEFFAELVEFITSGPVILMVLEADDAISRLRSLMGATDPSQAAPGSIRGDLAEIMAENLIHGSDSQESARKEISLFFTQVAEAMPNNAV